MHHLEAVKRVNVLKLVLMFPVFSIAQNINSTTTNLNSNLNKINDWAFQWKMNFDRDPDKQSQEEIFSKKLAKLIILLYSITKT